MIINKTYTLYNGVKIPGIALGTWQSKNGAEAYDSVLWAIEAGYRHIDTALAYGNEESVGKAIKDSKIAREDIFITTKLPAEIKGYRECKEAFAKSCKNLGVDYIDLYLIHAPWPWDAVGTDHTQGNIDSWKAMVELYNEGKIRAIGVSNFNQAEIESLINATGVKPMANQIRYFVGNTQPAISDYCQANDILVEAYSPLATGELVHNENLVSMAEKYHTSIARICIAYCLQKGALPLPKSVHKERIIDNLELDFEMSKEDIAALDEFNHIASTRPLRS